MINNPLVTVYVLNHNYQQYLAQCLDSVLNQSYENIEIFVIDDGSTDASSTILSKYEDEVGLTVHRQSNQGLVASIRKAFNIAKGDYVIRVDADDWVTEDFIELLVQRALEKNAAIVFPDYFEVDEDGDVLHRVSRFDFENEVQVYDTPAHGACTLIEKKAYFEVGGHLEGIACQDGVDLWLNMTGSHKVTNLKKPLFYYRKHAVSITQDNSTILKNRVNIFAHHAQKRFGSHKVVGVILIREKSLRQFRCEDDIFYLVNKAIETFKASTIISNIKIICEKQIEPIAKRAAEAIDNGKISVLPILSIVDKKLKIDDVLVQLSDNEAFDDYNCLISQSISYPLIKPAYVDLSAYTALIHGFNIVETVIENHDVVYQHNGSGLTEVSDPIERQERLSLYIKKGGITCYHKNAKHKKENLGKGHVVIDRHSSFFVGNMTDLAIAKTIEQQGIIYEKN